MEFSYFLGYVAFESSESDSSRLIMICFSKICFPSKLMLFSGLQSSNT